jgi:histidine triad (HIT) family protein
MTIPADECEFCGIICGSAPARIIGEDSETLAFLPLHPATRGHSLVIPKRHVANFMDAGETALASVMAMAARVARATTNVIHPEGLNLITSAGSAAGQTIFHLHVHVVPRWRDDAIGNIWPPKQVTPADTLDEVAATLREALR